MAVAGEMNHRTHKYQCKRLGPICLIADEGVNVSGLESEYDFIVLRVNEWLTQEMISLIRGSDQAKLSAI